MQAALYLSDLQHVPVDVFADPDGDWEYESLASAAGLDPDLVSVMIAALSEPWRGHPAGAAVVTAEGQPGFAIIDCASLGLASLRAA